MSQEKNSHSIPIGYLFWFFGFMGAHRFYYGKTKTGVLWFFTLGLCGIGWLLDLLLIPSMDREAELRFKEGPFDYNICWGLLTFLGILGIHRFYMQKWISGVLFLLTGGFFTLGVLYDYLNLNKQIHELNS